MRTSKTTGQAAPTPSEIGTNSDGPDLPLVRVIWHGTYGSTYQRYSLPVRDRLPASHGAHPDPETKGGYSIFSRPLECPNCRQSLELHQPEADCPDQLLGSCSHCGTRALLVVGDEGRMTLSVLPERLSSTRGPGSSRASATEKLVGSSIARRVCSIGRPGFHEIAGPVLRALRTGLVHRDGRMVIA